MKSHPELTSLAADLERLASRPDLVKLREIRTRIAAIEEELFGKQPNASRGTGARAKILAYFLSRGVGTPVTLAELKEVSGIQEFARRVRELRVEEGWKIAYDQGVYRLLEAVPNEERAGDWQLANSIRRRKDLNARDRILEYLQARVGRVVSGDVLSYVSEINEWARRLRELRDEQGWPISSFHDRPELRPEEYVLESLEQISKNLRAVSASTRKAVFERDEYRCRACGAVPGPGVWLEPDHVVEVAEGGGHNADNLVTVCHRCHTVKTAEYQNLRRDLRRFG